MLEQQTASAAGVKEDLVFDKGMPRSTGVEIHANSVSFLGVELQRWDLPKVLEHTPSVSQFSRHVITAFDERFMRDIAIALHLNLPLLIEGGTGISKTSGAKRVSAYLDYPCYYSNCHQFDADMLMGTKILKSDGSSGFADGSLLTPIRHGGVAFLDEYNFMRGESRGRIHEIVDALTDGEEFIKVIENDGEVVKRHPKFRLVLGQNAPGGGFSDREILDPAQFCRFVYLKMPELLPDEVRKARGLGYFNSYKPEQQMNITPSDYLFINPAFNQEKLKKIACMPNLVEQYLEFYEAFEALVKKRTIGSDQPQPIYLDFQRDFNRTIMFMENFYDGNPAATMQRAIEYFLVNMFESAEDRQKLRELAATIENPGDFVVEGALGGEAFDEGLVRARAHQLWKIAGEPDDLSRSQEFWDQAQQDLYGQAAI